MPPMDYSYWRKAGYLSAADLARALAVPAPTLHRWMRTGRLPFRLQGRRHFVAVADAKVFAAKQYGDPDVADSVCKAIERAWKSPKKRGR